MRPLATIASIGALIAAGAVTSTLLGRVSPTEDPPPPTPAVAEPVKPAPFGTDLDGKRRLRSLRWFAAAAGGTPDLNQVSIEQDMALVREVLGPEGLVLFAGGPRARVVQMLPEVPVERDPLLITLAEFFHPRPGRDATYRVPAIAVDGSATASEVRESLFAALAGGRDPLLVVFGGHGNQGEQPRDNTVGFWAQSALAVGDLATLFDDARRPVRLVMTTCFSGGFADLVFARADPTAGAAPTPRCGLFAAPWDLEASGCDPNPDRAAQEGYALHFFNALQGRDRDGKPLAPDELDRLDVDDDGRISLLEAHTRVRIASKAADVPTSTSERWLRAVAPERGRAHPSWSIPEEQAVVDALVEQLGLADREAHASVELDRFEREIEEGRLTLDTAQFDEDEAFRRAAADLLARWPVIDDPFHPEYPALLASERAEIAAHFERSPTYAAYVRARDAVDVAVEHVADLRRRAAPYERLTRAMETLDLARRLAAKGGADWRTYERLLACERDSSRSVPP